MLLAFLLGFLTLLPSCIIGVVGFGSGAFYVITAIGVALWEEVFGQQVDASGKVFIAVSVVATLILSLGFSTWLFSRIWDSERHVAAFFAAGIVAHVVAGILVGLKVS